MGVSIDGFVAVPSGGRLMPVMEGEWGLPPEDPDLTQRKLAWVWEAGAQIMGRTTYEEMAAYWPSSPSDYAAPMNEIPKVVFSKTLERAEWPDSRIARGDLAEEIATLKREPGKDVVAYGGAAFAQSHDVEDFHKGELSKGMEPQGEPELPGSGNREFALRDPDGYKLVFFQKK
jgi:hypothetical protein